MTAADGSDIPMELLYPFYLDGDMSMAFAAALAGGVALEEEQVDRSSSTSQAIKVLRGNLRLWRAGGFEAGRDRTEGSDTGTESRFVRRHTEASVFISLYDELRRTGQLKTDPPVEDVRPGDMVSVQLGPAIAPLRRVLDQVIRLFDVMVPMLPSEDDEPSQPAGTRQQRRQQARDVAQRVAATPEQNEGPETLRTLRRLFVAIRDDLELSGLIDIVVTREGSPGVLLTLDRRFVEPPALELLHTSEFTVVGKVTRVWPEEGIFVNPYRQSALSLVPSLMQSVAWGVFMLVGGLARSIDVKAMERLAQETFGQGIAPAATTEADAADAEQTDVSAQAEPASTGDAAEADEGEATTEADSGAPADFAVGDDVAALYSMIASPAYQVLPLALCS